jgi:PKD repeat protein
MTLRVKILTLIFILLGLVARAQNAPVTTAGVITNATTTPGGVIVPVTVTNFVSIGYFTLTLQYLISKATYVSASPNPAFPGMTVTHSINGATGKLVIYWPQTAGGVTLPDQSHLLDLTFTYLASTTVLLWGYTAGMVCEYKKYSNGNYLLLNDSPETSFYIDGAISNRGAPITYAPTIAGAVSGNTIEVPVTVTAFNTIGSVYLNLDYDSTVLVYQSLTPNPVFGGSFSYGVSAGTGVYKRITAGWYGGNITLADGSTIYTIRFTYNNNAGKGNYSTLKWYDDGPSCEYADAAGIGLIDIPYDGYYKNGLVYSQYAARTWLPVITDVTPNSGLTIPVKTKDFSNISSFILSFEYDTAALTYNGFTPHTILASGMTVTNNAPAGKKRKLVIAWTGSGPQTLPDSASVVILDFTYKISATTLAWVTGDATSCRFNDAVGNAYCDLPKSSFYQDGLIASQVAPLTAAWYASPAAGQQVTVPVLVYRYMGIGYWDLMLDYDPGVLTYQGATLVPAIGGTFSAATQGAGRIAMNWNGTAATLADSATLINLTFTYNGGESILAWHDDGNSCKYAASTTDSALYDIPTSLYYINGYVGPNPLIANFTGNNLLPAVNETVTFTDLSSGNPTSWQWSISPSTFQFVSGTSASSQNPQIKFTTNGVYTVTLKVYKGIFTGIKVRPGYIHAGMPGLWTGAISSDWTAGSNWHNYLVPGSAINVQIPSSAPNWPHVAGDLTIGANCNSITLTGPAELYVGGVLNINPGKILDIKANAAVYANGH